MNRVVVVDLDSAEVRLSHVPSLHQKLDSWSSAPAPRPPRRTAIGRPALLAVLRDALPSIGNRQSGASVLVTLAIHRYQAERSLCVANSCDPSVSDRAELVCCQLLRQLLPIEHKLAKHDKSADRQLKHSPRHAHEDCR